MNTTDEIMAMVAAYADRCVHYKCQIVGPEFAALEAAIEQLVEQAKWAHHTPALLSESDAVADLAGVARPGAEPPLLGRWHHGNGVLVSGTIRIARWDCDTNPPEEFRDEVLSWVCDTLNAAMYDNQSPSPEYDRGFCVGWDKGYDHGIGAAQKAPQARQPDQNAVDADRYRWLRNINPTRFAVDFGGDIADINSKEDGQREMDAVIDAAIAAQKGKP